MDNFYANTDSAFLRALRKNNIIVLFLVPGFTDYIQPNDQAANKILKKCMSDHFGVWFTDQVCVALLSRLWCLFVYSALVFVPVLVFGRDVGCCGGCGGGGYPPSGSVHPSRVRVLSVMWVLLQGVLWQGG